MGGAMLAGWLASGMDPARFTIVDPQLTRVPDGVQLLRQVPDESAHDCVLLGFKPQQLGVLSSSFQSMAGSDVTVFSLLAGITGNILHEAFPQACAHIRVMPNLAARIGKSPVILCGNGLDREARDAAQALFGALGKAVWLDDEARFDLVTALVGSGPGFVYRFIDALSRAAHDLGLDEEASQSLSLAVVEGAASLAAQANEPSAALADKVASPGGMTREGLDVLDRGDALKVLLRETLKATSEKGGSLSRAAREQSSQQG